MNIIVCAKQVVDVSEMKVDSSTKKPILQGVPQKISDIDKNAMEEAIKIKDKHGGKITVLTCLLYTSPSPRDRTRSRMPSSA